MRLTIKYIERYPPFNEFVKTFEGNNPMECKEAQFEFESTMQNMFNFNTEIIEFVE